MKRLITIILTLSLILSMGICVPAQAADEAFTFTLLANGKTSAAAAVGGEVTVTLKVTDNSGGENFDLYSMQDYVCFDPQYLEYVADSIEVYTIDGTLTKVVTADPIKFSSTASFDEVFVNRGSLSSVSVKSSAVLLTFKLKALKTGTVALTNARMELSKSTGSLYPVASQTASVVIGSTPTPPSGGGGIGGGGEVPTPNIVITESENGSVTAEPSDAAQGSTVTITAAPNAGYHCGVMTVIDSSGNQLPVTDSGSGIYTFIMPEGAVTVTAIFQKTFSNSDGYKDCKKDSTCRMAAYTDLDPAAWYHDGVHYCLENGLMNGVDIHRFDPSGTSTRAMIVTILYRLEGSPAVTGSNPYHDVPSGLWYTDAVLWANANKIVEGYGNGAFGPDDPITREQMAAILYRYASCKGFDLSSAADLSRYIDVGKISDWALTAIRWANANDLINGLPGNLLAPSNDAIRVQTATILQRFCENIVK